MAKDYNRFSPTAKPRKRMTAREAAEKYANRQGYSTTEGFNLFVLITRAFVSGHRLAKREGK